MKEPHVTHIPSKIWVSFGSAIVLGLMEGMLDVAPTTIYLLTYRNGKCLANCAFCPQAHSSSSRTDLLARVIWHVFSIAQVVKRIELLAKNSAIKRVCIQALNYPTVFSDVLYLTKLIHLRSNVPISVSIQPLDRTQMKTLAAAGVDRISIALDAATEELFDKVKGASAKGPYTWKQHRETLEEAVQVFSQNRVSTHLIVGLGETEKELIKTIQWCCDSGICPSLFAFTPIVGTTLENHHQPPIEKYRRLQLARYLIVYERTRFENMKFNKQGQISSFGVSKIQLKKVISESAPFRTSGCPECNRPYYNERPRGPIYNYPRPLKPEEIFGIEKSLKI